MPNLPPPPTHWSEKAPYELEQHEALLRLIRDMVHDLTVGGSSLPGHYEQTVLIARRACGEKVSKRDVEAARST